MKISVLFFSSYAIRKSKNNFRIMQLKSYFLKKSFRLHNPKTKNLLERIK